MEIGTEILCLVFAITFIILIKALWNIKDLTEKNSILEEQTDRYRKEVNHLLNRIDYITKQQHKVKKEIPKGTVQAVKEAMKRSHPDNGGNAEDFQMYRRAYNILTGKEKI